MVIFTVMIQNHFEVIGVMSGTSLDGIDIAYCKFDFSTEWHFKIIQAETIAYDDFWKEQLKDLVHKSPQELHSIDQKYTGLLATEISKFIKKHKIEYVDAVCSHGHTALHQPAQGLTYQIGNLPILADLIQQQVICDFRVQDVALGGQGAPLVPIGDRLLFSNFSYCINLGGFANISFENNKDRIAYDICPVNIVLNHYVSSLGMEYDNNGVIAASGDMNADLFMQLNKLDYYHSDFPKSLGLEWVKTHILPLIDGYKLPVKDVLRTFVDHVSHQILNNLPNLEEHSVLLTGGGAYNGFLINCLKKSHVSAFFIPEQQLVEYKEALIFAFLGILKMRNEANCLSSVTGAKKNHSSGKIYIPQNN